MSTAPTESARDTWTDPQAVVDEWVGEDAPDDVVLVGKWVAKAERLLRREVPDLRDRITAGEEDLLDNVADVVASIVARKFRNPEGARQVQETTGPFSASKTYAGDSPGELEITAKELERLSGGTRGRRRVYAVDMLPPDYRRGAWT